MAYYSGTATSYSDLLNALVNACVAEGWLWSDSILSKDNVYVQLNQVTYGIALRGGNGKSGTSLLNASTVRPCFGNFGATQQPSFPVSYNIFIFENEVYFIVKFNLTNYYYCAFGKSDIELPESGLWLCANSNYNTTEVNNPRLIYLSSTNAGNNNAQSFVSPVLPFWSRNYGSYSIYQNSTILTGLSGQLWAGSPPAAVGLELFPLLDRQPSNWSGESIFLPINIYQPMPENKSSLVCQFRNARLVRIDNYEPEQIVTFGNEKWKIFPFYKKNSSERGGGSAINHTGTFGWAIRYDGL